MSGAPGKSFDKVQAARIEAPTNERAPLDSAGAHHAVLVLQRTAGNQAVTSLLGGSSGKPLDASTRREMESKFGAEFGDVRVHSDRRASVSAAVLGANAWTSGHDIVFDEGFYSPLTAGGKKLLAHELAHVVQQRRGGVTPRTFETGGAAEQDAAKAASQFAGAGPVSVAAATGVGVAQQAADEPWWKKRLNPIYQRALEVLPKPVAEKLEQANARAKELVSATGASDEGLNRAVKTAEPVLKPIADLLGVKSDEQPAPKGDHNRPTTWLGTPPIDVQLKQHRDQQAAQAALDQNKPGALAPPIQNKNVPDLPPLDVLLRPDPPPTEFESKLKSGKPFQTKIHPRPDLDPRNAVWLGERPSDEQLKNMRFKDPNDPSKRIWVDENKEVGLPIDSDSTMPIRDSKTHELKGYRVRHGDTITELDRNGEVRGRGRNLEQPLEHPPVDPIDVAFFLADTGPLAAKGLQAGGKALIKALTKSGTRELSEVGGEEATTLLAREASDALNSRISHPQEFPEIDFGTRPANEFGPQPPEPTKVGLGAGPGPTNEVEPLEYHSLRPALPDEQVISPGKPAPPTESPPDNLYDIESGKKIGPSERPIPDEASSHAVPEEIQESVADVAQEQIPEAAGAEGRGPRPGQPTNMAAGGRPKPPNLTAVKPPKTVPKEPPLPASQKLPRRQRADFYRGNKSAYPKEIQAQIDRRLARRTPSDNALKDIDRAIREDYARELEDAYGVPIKSTERIPTTGPGGAGGEWERICGPSGPVRNRGSR
jgi:hypothetical protein